MEKTKFEMIEKMKRKGTSVLSDNSNEVIMQLVKVTVQEINAPVAPPPASSVTTGGSASQTKN
jgi:hypothetical protein